MVDGKRCIDIKRKGQQEQIVLTKTLKHDRSIAGRGTTWWAGYLETDPKIKLIVKDMWDIEDGLCGQYSLPEGESLRELSKIPQVVNIEHYYHSYTVCVDCMKDDVMKCCRRRLCTQKSKHPWVLRHVYGTEISSGKIFMPENRRHNRVIVLNNGKPLYKANSHASLLAAVKCCIQGHKSLLEAEYLHRNITLDNLMIDIEDETRGFLVNFEMATGTTTHGESLDRPKKSRHKRVPGYQTP